MVVSKHEIQTFEVVVVILLLLLLSFDVFVPTIAHPLLFLDKSIVQIYLNVSFLCKMDYNNDKFIHPRMYTYNMVMRFLELACVVERMF